MDNRAKQFVPFAAVKGYEEALRAKEKIAVEKTEVSEIPFEDIYDLSEDYRIFEQS